jgi:beta-mannosidase
MAENLKMPQRVNLNQGWFLQQVDDADGIEHEKLSVPSVPTDVYQVLLAHGKIADPVKDLNELSVRWVADKQWRYTTKLHIDTSAVKNGETLDLVFEGLDTFATVRLDGQVILESSNMFLSHRCNINSIVGGDEFDGEHELEITFASARLRGQQLVEEHKHEHRFIARQSEDSRIPVRKAQYHWGWDWGPILVGTSGPWRPVYLEYYSTKIDDLWARTTLQEDGSATGYLYCRTRNFSPGDKVMFSISYDDDEVFQGEMEPYHDDCFFCRFEIQAPRLW